MIIVLKKKKYVLIGLFFIFDKIMVIIFNLFVEVFYFKVIFILIVEIILLKIVFNMILFEIVLIGMIFRNKVINII